MIDAVASYFHLLYKYASTWSVWLPFECRAAVFGLDEVQKQLVKKLAQLCHGNLCRNKIINVDENAVNIQLT